MVYIIMNIVCQHTLSPVLCERLSDHLTQLADVLALGSFQHPGNQHKLGSNPNEWESEDLMLWDIVNQVDHVVALVTDKI